jgi:hypothetical protein
MLTYAEQVHELFGDLFLITCQLVNRYKLHQSSAFLRHLERIYAYVSIRQHTSAYVTVDELEFSGTWRGHRGGGMRGPSVLAFTCGCADTGDVC